MDRVFRIDFYPQDWLVDTARMSLDERGLYIQIVSMIYANRGPIENDPSWIGRAGNCSSRMARKIIASLIEKGFVQKSGTKLSQKRAEHELKMKRTHFETSSKGGRKAAENDASSHKINGITFSEPIPSLSTPAPAPAPSPLAKLAGGEEVCIEETLPSLWHDLAEKRGIPDEQIYMSWRKFKDTTSHPFRLRNWVGWIARERV